MRHILEFFPSLNLKHLETWAHSSQLESCLKHIFSKYCTPKSVEATANALLTPPDGAYLTAEALDAWARDTNGAPFQQETKEELVEFLDVTVGGDLT